MSWSVNASGTPATVKTELNRQFSYPLADAPAGLADEGERETVRRVSDAISQCLNTFDPTKVVNVSANGHMGYGDWDAKTGAYQNVSISIAPKS